MNYSHQYPYPSNDPPPPPRPSSHSSSPPPAKDPPVIRDGDWECSDCKNINFSRRMECNRCKTPKPLPKKISKNSSNFGGSPGLFKRKIVLVKK